MSLYGERPPSGEDYAPHRLIPVSEEAVMKGIYTSIGAGPENWGKFLKRFGAKSEIKMALDGKLKTPHIAKTVGEGDWARRYAATNPLEYITGAGVYYSCLAQEALLNTVTVPEIVEADRLYWVGLDVPNFDLIMADLDTDYIESPFQLRAYIHSIGERFEVFTTETDPTFCRVLDREVNFSDSALDDMKLGAMDIHYLFKAHYDRIEFENHLSL